MRNVKILVRLPNWLGDLVMAAGFMQQLATAFPEAEICVIVKKGLEDLLPFLPVQVRYFVFDKKQHRGPRGAWSFGQTIRNTEKFDVFFSLPDSFSAALIGRASGARVRIGYKKELRNLLLTHAYSKPGGLHRALVYTRLLESYTKQDFNLKSIALKSDATLKEGLVMNINSEASSRRLTVAKAVELLAALQKATPEKITLIGALKEAAFVHEVLKKFPSHQFENKAGQTNLPQLAHVLASAKVLLTTDSGPAHLANALGTFTIVLFGAGNEKETAPYNSDQCTVLRLGQLECEPCEKNVCLRYDTPQCLERLNSGRIVHEVLKHL